MIKLIIFDLDGTLVDAYPAITASFNYVMKKLNYPLQKPITIRRAVGWGDKDLLSPFVKSRDLEMALALYRRNHKTALLKKSSLLPGVKYVLKKLKKQGYKLAVASNRPTVFSLVLIRHLKLNRYLDYILCADSPRFRKPHPQMLNRIMNKFFAKPSESLYVGDMTIDAQTGRRAKVKTVIVTTGSSSGLEIRKEKPYRIIGNIKELLS
jgi:phosphoglycolate phosphatase